MTQNVAVSPVDAYTPASQPGRLRNAAAMLARDRTAIFGLFIILCVVIMAVFAPVLAPYDPLKQDLSASKMPPAWQEGGSWDHVLGTDKLGRDQLSRIIYGARVSVTVGVLGATLACLLGMGAGLLAGYLGGWVDGLLTAFINLLLMIPYLVVVIVVAAVVGRSLVNVILLFGITASPLFARITRGEVLRLRNSTFVESATAVGAGHSRILLHHLVPNLVGIMVTLATYEMSAMIFYEAGLSFLGLSVPPDVPSWGNMLSAGRESLMSGMPWLTTYPGLAIAVTALGVNFFGDWLRDVLDPRQRR